MSNSLGSGRVEYNEYRPLVHFASGATTPHHDAGKPENVVNHPRHYTAYRGLEVIDLTEQMNFNRGNAVKYIARAGLKDPGREKEDLEKAIWYCEREIKRISQLNHKEPE